MHFTDAAFFTNWRQNPPPAERLQIAYHITHFIVIRGPNPQKPPGQPVCLSHLAQINSEMPDHKSHLEPVKNKERSTSPSPQGSWENGASQVGQVNLIRSIWQIWFNSKGYFITVKYNNNHYYYKNKCNYFYKNKNIIIMYYLTEEDLLINSASKLSLNLL